jgi:hypothetical protein
VWYSVSTTGKTPSELSSDPWYRSDPDMGIAGYDQELSMSKFQCIGNVCTLPSVAAGNNQCGPNGKCAAIGGNTSGTKCVCEGLFAGPHCEFGISSTYTSNQLKDIYAVTSNSTNYPNFLQSIKTSNSALNNDFYEQYWKETIKSFFQQAAANNVTGEELSDELRALFNIPPLAKNETVQ